MTKTAESIRPGCEGSKPWAEAQRMLLGVEMFTHKDVDVWWFLPIRIGKFANLWTDVFFTNNNRDLIKLIGSIEILSSEQLEFYHDWRDKQKSWGYQPALAACGDVIYYNGTIGCKQLGLATLSSTMMAFLRSSEVGYPAQAGRVHREISVSNSRVGCERCSFIILSL